VPTARFGLELRSERPRTSARRCELASRARWAGCCVFLRPAVHSLAAQRRRKSAARHARGARPDFRSSSTKPHFRPQKKELQDRENSIRLLTRLSLLAVFTKSGRDSAFIFHSGGLPRRMALGFHKPGDVENWLGYYPGPNRALGRRPARFSTPELGG